MTWKYVTQVGCIFAVLLAWTMMAGINQAQPPWGSTCIDEDGDGYGNPASSACPHPELDCNDDPSMIPQFVRPAPVAVVTVALAPGASIQGLLKSAMVLTTTATG